MTQEKPRFFLRCAKGVPRGEYLDLFAAAVALFETPGGIVVPESGTLYELQVMGKHPAGLWNDSLTAYESFQVASESVQAVLYVVTPNGNRRAIIWTTNPETRLTREPGSR